MAVHHSVDEDDQAVDFKKSIAAAFQANFKGTDQEEENDPQSAHLAHYRYVAILSLQLVPIATSLMICRYDKDTASESRNVQKMHRSIKSDDVIDYSTGARKRDIQLTKDEDIEYRDGILYHSSGDSLVKIKDRKETQDDSQKSFSDAFSAHGSYNLDLHECHPQTVEERSRQRRNVDDQMSQNMKEEGLKISFNTS